MTRDTTHLGGPDGPVEKFFKGLVTFILVVGGLVVCALLGGVGK
jgi:hypothetical protein